MTTLLAFESGPSLRSGWQGRWRGFFTGGKAFRSPWSRTGFLDPATAMPLTWVPFVRARVLGTLDSSVGAPQSHL